MKEKPNTAETSTWMGFKVYLPKLVVRELEEQQTVYHLGLSILLVLLVLVVSVAFREKIMARIRYGNQKLIQKMSNDYANKMLYVDCQYLEDREFLELRNKTEESLFGGSIGDRICDQGYMSINGEEIMVRIVDEPKYIKAVSKGRTPRYDNEIVMTEIGIYKALGFTATKLRLQFAARFAIISLIGSIIGSLVAVFLAGNMLSSILRLAGISSFNVTFSVLTFALPVSVICVCFFLFAFLASRGVRRVAVRELVIE